jgi:hypothetical protein
LSSLDFFKSKPIEAFKIPIEFVSSLCSLDSLNLVLDFFPAFSFHLLSFFGYDIRTLVLALFSFPSLVFLPKGRQAGSVFSSENRLKRMTSLSVSKKQKTRQM